MFIQLQHYHDGIGRKRVGASSNREESLLLFWAWGLRLRPKLVGLLRGTIALVKRDYSILTLDILGFIFNVSMTIFYLHRFQKCAFQNPTLFSAALIDNSLDNLAAISLDGGHRLI